MKYDRKPVAGYVVALLFAGMAISCSKDQVLEPVSTTPNVAPVQSVQEGDYHGEIISQALAKQVAETSEFQQLFLRSSAAASGARRSQVKRTVRRAMTLNDNHNHPAAHVMSYEQGGFAILSAEKSFAAVLAVGDEGNVDPNQMPEVVKDWLNQTRDQIGRARISRRGARQSATNQSLSWATLLANTGLNGQNSGARSAAPAPEPDPIKCSDCPDPEPGGNPPCQQIGEPAFFGPLVKTTWNQSEGDFLWPYNKFAPNGALAGCGPVAAAQLMRYYQHPSTYVCHIPGASYGKTLAAIWGNNYNSSSFSTANIMASFGYSANATWGGTPGAETSTNTDNMAAALKNNFGYKTVYVKTGPTLSDILSQLSSYRPVLLRGSKYSGGSGGHIWVVDGSMTIKSNCAVPEFHWMHMNWGWGGYWNGYFSDSYSSGTTGTTYYTETGTKTHTADSDPGTSQNSDMFYYGRRMIVAYP
ncbi:C10 family peptidase [Spirosoma montaniterrae]|uniref:Spi protease inhibitor domain-containing protein n=1 Tax=Spirosoma montaniterrae TaxID=1178516 RepID=A0A1P9WYM8_9BACT|nr:C10 family peptidase [Spirosoma montaniterrae]AQG80482.1 hypothetical protein AWR27_14815 [Spirosoma montaniterrae]